MSKPFYITTTLPYVNADPHIGFAMELVQADVLARFSRLEGREVFFNTGTDEHGQKISDAAKNAGESEQDYVDRYADKVNKLKNVLNLSTDTFVRTTDKHHIKAAQKL
ncbi:MAG TPA: methionine--tRNA ligase, partial [Candidatus Kaiserbacteria bacterium]|nr:methionine--tRNA ligase [Candidatus Kaiserbacteria bacterium]